MTIQPVLHSNSPNTHTIVAIGAGGNIGSHLVPHLGRMPGVGRVLLVDRDIYEDRNRASQQITPNDVGKPKAMVQARRLQAMNPDLQVEGFVGSVEALPLGHLNCALILTGLDSREARRIVNQKAWRLGVPWIDAGVEGSDLLARVTFFLPSPDAPCLECKWDHRDYAALEQNFSCQGTRSTPTPTHAPSGLGALAASLQALECHKWLSGKRHQTAVSREIVIHAGWHKHFDSTLRKNPACRFNHGTWTINPITIDPCDLTPEKLFAIDTRRSGEKGRLTLGVEGHQFTEKLTCTRCGKALSAHLHLVERIPSFRMTCPCGGKRMPTGFDLIEQLDSHRLSDQILAQPLSRLGLRPGDVVSLESPFGKTHYMIGG
jgi:molybdopterin/thiamine biosynthesis adenylyltransferase